MADGDKVKISKEDAQAHIAERKAVFSVGLDAAKSFRDAILDVAKGPNQERCDNLAATSATFQQAATGIRAMADKEQAMGLPNLADKTRGQIDTVNDKLASPAAQAQQNCGPYLQQQPAASAPRPRAPKK
jgi:hypothetical protein